MEGKTRAELVAQKRPVVLARREDYLAFWEAHVRPAAAPPVLPPDAAPASGDTVAGGGAEFGVAGHEVMRQYTQAELEAMSRGEDRIKERTWDIWPPTVD